MLDGIVHRTSFAGPSVAQRRSERTLQSSPGAMKESATLGVENPEKITKDNAYGEGLRVK